MGVVLGERVPAEDVGGGRELERQTAAVSVGLWPQVPYFGTGRYFEATLGHAATFYPSCNGIEF
eukprot:5805829-Pleurochrysis_carterae.AAC.2